MHNLITDVQLKLLAHTLGVTPDAVATFERLGFEKIQTLRELASAYLFDELAPIFGRVSNLAPLVPDTLVTKVAELAVPPLVAGRASGALGLAHPHRINAILRRLSPEYMADSAASIDPRVISLISAGLDIQLLIPAARILLARKDFTTVTLLISSVDNDRLFTELLESISADGEHLDEILQALMYAPSDTWINNNLRRLPRPLLENLFSTTEFLAVLAVLARLDTDLRSGIANHLVDTLEPDELRALTTTAHTHAAHSELQSFAEALSNDRREQFDRVAAPAATDGQAQAAT